MENLFTHLKDVFSTEPFSENQSAFTITVYTNLDYAADQVYAYVKRSKGSTNGHILLNNKRHEIEWIIHHGNYDEINYIRILMPYFVLQKCF